MEQFDFNEFVTQLVVAALQKDPEVQDVLTIAAEETVTNLVDKSVEDLKLVDREEFDEMADRVYDAEQDLDVISDSVEDGEARLDALERESVYEEDFERLEQDFMSLERKFRHYQPLLEVLSKMEPVLRLLGLVKDEEDAKIYHQHPKFVYPEHSEQERPANNWLS